MTTNRHVRAGAVALAMAMATVTAAGVAAAQTEDGGATVKYDKGFTLATADEDFELEIAGRVQPRWSLERSTEDGAEFEHFFEIARARVTLEGHAFGDAGVDYKMQTEFGKGFTYLRDFYLDKTMGPIHARFGQWKRPYSRQQITSSGNQQLVDRSITDKFAGAGRDIGFAIHNNYEKSPEGLEWALGVYNGTGEKPAIGCDSEVTDPLAGAIATDCGLPSNVPGDIGPMVVARVGFNHGKIKGYSESDLEGGPLRAAAGVSYMGDLNEGSDLVHRIAVDAILKVEGASLTGGFYLLEQPEVDAEVAFFAQGGWFVTPKQLELAARFSRVPAGDESTNEIVGGLNVFLHGHSLKWQTDGGVLHTTGVDSTTVIVVRTQAQLVF